MANALGDKKGFGEPFWGSGFLPEFVLDPPRVGGGDKVGMFGRKTGGRCGWSVVNEGEGREEVMWSALFQGQEKSSQGPSQRSERT